MHKKSPWFIFTLLAIAQFMIVLDVSITNVALPAIKQSLHFTSTSSLQWVITAYALTFGGFLLLGGRAADLFGRRKILLIGMISFTFFSLLIGLSQTALMLIILRAFQGLAAALMSPSALSTVLITFKEGSDRNKALGYWSLVATGGAAMGLLFGGVLTQYFGWEWNFFVNVPIGILVAWGIYSYVPAHGKQAEHSHLDILGAGLVTSGLITLVYAISQGPAVGWFNNQTLLAFSIAFGLLTLFIINESRTAHPILPLRFFTIRNVVGANAIMAPVMASMLGMFFLTSIYIQSTLHFSPIKTGLSFLPFPIILGFVATNIPRFVSKYGYKPFLITGPILVSIALTWLSRLPVNATYFHDILPTLIIMPMGIGMTFMPVIAAATSGVRQEETGLASGMITTSQQMGGALGLAVLSGVAASVTNGLTTVNKTQGLVKGYDQAYLTGVGFALFALLIAITVIKQNQKKA